MTKNIDEDINIVLDKEINLILNKNVRQYKSKKILVLSGGSLKGFAQLGAMHCLKKYDLLKDIKTIAATSAGTFVGMLYCAGYNPMEMYKFFNLLDMDRCTKIDTNNIMTKYGLDDGSRIILVMSRMLGAKGFSGDVLFDEFYKKTGMTLIITGVCVNDKKVYYFSHTTYPKMKVLDAVRISISIPVVFTPFVYEGKTFVDGGCIDNFPINLFKNNIDETIGIYVTEKRKIVHDIKYIDDYLNNVLQCLYEGITYRDMLSHSKNVIQIRCTDASSTHAAMSCMFDEGYRSALQKINEWDEIQTC